MFNYIKKHVCQFFVQRKRTETWTVWYRLWCNSCWTLTFAAWMAFRVWCRRSGWWPAIASWTDATIWRKMKTRRWDLHCSSHRERGLRRHASFSNQFLSLCYSLHCSPCSWTVCGRWRTSTQQHLSSQKPIWLCWVTACGSLSSVLSSSILLNSVLKSCRWETFVYN